MLLSFTLGLQSGLLNETYELLTNHRGFVAGVAKSYP